MSAKGSLWLITLTAAIAGALLGAGAVWASQQSTLASLEARLIQAGAERDAALDKTQELTTELEDIKATPSSSAPTGTEAAAVPQTDTKKPAKAEKQFAYIKTIDESEAGPVIAADYAQMLTGDAAAAAATAAGDESPPPNDYYIVNVNKQLRKLDAKPGLSVRVTTNSDGTSDPSGHTVTFADWAAEFSAPTGENAALREAPYWIWIRNGTVVKIEQQYLP